MVFGSLSGRASGVCPRARVRADLAGSCRRYRHFIGVTSSRPETDAQNVLKSGTGIPRLRGGGLCPWSVVASASPACAGAGSADDSWVGGGSPTRTFALGTPSPCHAEPGFHTRSQRSKAAISLDKELVALYGNRKTQYRTMIVRWLLRPEYGRMVIRPYGRRKRAAQPCHPGLRSAAPHDSTCSTYTMGTGPIWDRGDTEGFSVSEKFCQTKPIVEGTGVQGSAT